MDQLSEDDILRTVEVLGLSDGIDQDDLYGYFENPRFGGGQIETLLQHSGSEGSTLITFKDKTVVDNLLERQKEKKARISGVTVDFRRCKKPKPVKPVQVIGREIVVSGIPADWDEDDLIPVLENTRKGGGKVEHVVSAEIPRTSFVEFVDQSVAERFAENGKIQVGGVVLKITWPLRLGNGSIVAEEPREESICTCTIVVENFPRDQLDHLQLNLESKRHRGGILESINLDSAGRAVAKFVDESVAARFLEQGAIKIKGKSYPIVKPPLTVVTDSSVPEFPDTIEVSGIPEKTSEDFLRMYFENKRRSGGSEIKAMNYRPEEGIATITFCDPGAVREILDKGEHKLSSDALLQVIALESLTPDLIDQVCAIRVTNIPPNMSRDLVECHFESERRSGGDVFEEVYHDKNNQSAIIIYRSVEVRRRVVSRMHVLDSVQLGVETLQPAPPSPIVVGETEEKKLLIGNLPADFKDEELKTFIEKTGCQVTKFTRGSLPDVVLLNFKDVPNYLALRKLVVSRPFCCQMISVQKVKPSASVIIHGARSLSQDLATLHFENTRRSGGGDVKNVRRNGDGDIIIEFCDRSVIPRVLEKKQEIENIHLEIKLYNECLFEETGSSFYRKKIQIPEDLIIPVDRVLLQYLSHCPSFREKMEAEMQPLDCAIQWQMPDNTSIKLSCTLTPKCKDLGRLVAKWESVCTEQISTLLDQIIVKEEKLGPDIWEDFVREVKVVDQSGIVCEFDDSSQSFRIIGDNKTVGLYLKDVTGIRNDLQAKLAKRMKKTYKSLNTIQPYKLRLLKILNLSSSDMGLSNDVTVKVDDQQVSFEGSEEDINQAMIKIYEITNYMQCRQFPNFDPLKVKFLQKKEVVDYLTDLLQKESLRVAWNVDNKVLEISGMSDKEINQSFSTIDSEFLYKDIKLDVNQIPTIKDSKWNDFKKTAKDAFKIMDIQFDQQISTIKVFSIKDMIDAIIHEIDEFLNQNTILEQFLPLEDGKVNFIDKFSSREIKDLEKQLDREGVVIELMPKKQSSGVLIRGTKTGLEMAATLLNDIHQQILSIDFESETYVVPKFFKTLHGQESIDKIQNKHKVIIDITRQLKNSRTSKSSDGKQLDEVSKGPVVKSTIGIKGSVIKVLKGSLIECQAKVLVVSVKDDLKHKDGVAKAVVEAGGHTIEDECHMHVKSNGKLLPGQIFTSKPGKLSCSAIVHIALPKWKDGKDGKEKELNCLFEGVWLSLAEAKHNGWSSVAISGSTGFPASAAAKVIVEATDEFLNRESSFPLEISLIDSSDQVVNHFHEALVGKFGKEVKIHGGKDNSPITSPALTSAGPSPPTIDTKYQQGKDPLTLVTPEGVQVTLIQGSIAAQKADVIVNTASKELNLTQGAVSNSIQQVAGPNLQTECKTKAPNGLKAGDMITTAGHSLQCKHVYHVVCDNWDGGKGGSEMIVRDLLKKALQTAHQTQMISIAIPALGTGNLGFPKNVVCAIMYEEAEKFSKSNPATTVKDVRFLVFDDETVKAFQELVKYLINPNAAVNIQASFDKKRHRYLKQTLERYPVEEKQENRAEEAALDDDIALNEAKGTLKIKSLLMEIKKGDITQENTDAIVNSTNKDLNLSGGAVTKAILAAGGPSIAKECKALGKTNDNGIAVTGAGNLQCKMIIHLAAPDTSSGKTWEHRIFNCLTEAEKLKLASISFPFLGTGALNTSPAEIAVNMLNAVGKFAVSSKPKHLKTIRICIFQAKMVDEFFSAISTKLKEKKPGTGLWGKFTGWLSSIITTPDSKDGSSENFELLDDVPSYEMLHDYQTVFKIFGLSQAVIDQVIVDIEDLMKTAVTDKVLDAADLQESIAKLTSEQIRRIENDAAAYQVRATIEQGKKINRIRLQGDANDITDVFMNVMKILREIDAEAHRRNEAERIAEQAHWEYQDGDDYDSYPPEINAIIEQAFRSKVGFAQWEEADGKFKIDFKSNTEEDLVSNKKTTVRRIGDAPIEEPKHWDPMNPGEACRLVHVPVGSNEYNEVETRIKASCQQSCKEIVKVERVQNPSLYHQYAVKKLHMEASAGTGAVTERILWHGTSKDTVQQINTHGFNRSYCGKNATFYGQGVYFARDWTYSAQDKYSPLDSQGFKSIYYTKVLTGEFALGSTGLVDTPLKPNQNVERYDSVVENIANPSIFVIFRDAQAYPEYLITFMV